MEILRQGLQKVCGSNSISREEMIKVTDSVPISMSLKCLLSWVGSGPN